MKHVLLICIILITLIGSTTLLAGCISQKPPENTLLTPGATRPGTAVPTITQINEDQDVLLTPVNNSSVAGPATTPLQDQNDVPKFSRGDVIQDPSKKRYVVYGEKWQTKTSYLVYDLSQCPGVEKIILPVQDVDSRFTKIDTMDPGECLVPKSSQQTVLCGLPGKWESATPSTAMASYLDIYSNRTVDYHYGDSFLLTRHGTWEVPNPYDNTMSITWSDGGSERVELTPDCELPLVQYGTFIKASATRAW